MAVPFYDDGTSGSPLRLRDLFQEFLNLMDLAQRWRAERRPDVFASHSSGVISYSTSG